MMIRPPFPNPSDWERVRRLQVHHNESHWLMTRKSYGELHGDIFPSKHNLESVQQGYYSSINTDQIETVAKDVSKYLSRETDSVGLDVGSDLFQEEISNNIVDTGSKFNSCDDFVFDQRNADDAEEEEGYEIETLEVSDYWVERLSNTMNKINARKKKSNKSR